MTALFLDGASGTPSDCQVETGRVVGVSLAAPIEGRVNEDAGCLVPLYGGGLVLAVADGLGGHPGGEQASAAAVRALAACLEGVAATEAREAVLAGFDRANAAVRALGGAATTLIAAVVVGRSARTYHVGDSGSLLFGARGKVKHHTTAHSPVGYALEAGWIEEQEALVHEDRHLVSNVLGDEGMRVEMSATLELARRDTLVLASDGLFDNLDRGEIVEGLRRGALDRAVMATAGRARARMLDPEGRLSKPDDLTLLAYRPGPSKSSS